LFGNGSTNVRKIQYNEKSQNVVKGTESQGQAVDKATTRYSRKGKTMGEEKRKAEEEKTPKKKNQKSVGLIWASTNWANGRKKAPSLKEARCLWDALPDTSRKVGRKSETITKKHKRVAGKKKKRGYVRKTFVS